MKWVHLFLLCVWAVLYVRLVRAKRGANDQLKLLRTWAIEESAVDEVLSRQPADRTTESMGQEPISVRHDHPGLAWSKGSSQVRGLGS